MANTPSRCNVNVSSRPSAKLRAADLVAILQFRLQARERGFGFRIGRALIGPLQSASPGGLLPLR